MAKVIIDSSHKYTDVATLGDPGPGGAHHHYVITPKPDLVEKEPLGNVHIDFQTGPIKEAGVNGVMDENLVAIVINRLEGFQSGPYACKENADALEAFKMGLDALRSRTARRESSGAEGTHKTAPGDASHEATTGDASTEAGGLDQ